MRCLRLSRYLKDSGKYLALLLVLCCSGVGRADKFPPDPVLEFRQALSLSLREYLPRDPEQLAKLENGPVEQRAAFLKNARTSDLLHRMELLKSVPEMRRALGAQEWREKGSDEQNKIDGDVRDILVDRFAKKVTDTLQNGSQIAKLAMMGMLAEIGTNTRLIDDRTRIAKVFTPALTKLIRTAGDREIRMTAARTVSQIGCDPAEAAPALGELLQSKDPGERRAAAEGLAGIIQLLNNLSNQSKDDLTNERAIMAGVPPADNSLVLFARREVISAATKVLPYAKTGANDSDVEVRRNCLNCIYQSVYAMGQQIPQPLNTGEMQDIRDDVLRIQETRRMLMPLFDSVRDLADSLGKATRDRDAEVRLLARKAIEEISFARERLPGTSQTADAKNDPLLETLIRMLPELVAGVTDADAATRLLAIDALEAMGKEAAPVAPTLIKAISDPNQFVRWAAARTMGKMAPTAADRAVPALRTLLHDREIDLCLAAATALERYGPTATSAIPDLIEASRTTDVVLRVAALKTIAGIGSGAQSAVPAIATSLQDPEPRVRQTAAEVLGQFGPLAIEAEPALRASLNDSSADVRRAVSDALLNILQVGEKK
ncbi:MAG TPA: HEAT repeat domain-containing protein [Gemmataceae bacterium]|nr:HEAT repeat domain-containing protein [Gemmataceae bacterium]